MFASVKTKIKIFTITLIALVGFFVCQNQDAKAAVDPHINFQGKVTNTDGTNVANGSYTFLFCLYSTPTPATACTAGANNDATWRESKSITVTDGIFQTNLGSVTALPTASTFNTTGLHLGINFNANGQMTPLVEFTSAPYAFNSEKLQGGDWAAPGTIGSTTQNTGNFTTLNADSITTDTGGISIAAGQSYGGTGAVTLSSTTNGLTLNSGNGTVTIDSGDTALTASGVTTLTLGANTTITNASGNISLQAAGTGTANIQIGDGGATSATPDLLVLDIGSAEPVGTIGAMYYSTALNKFRCYQVSAWADCIGTSGGTQTPWAQDISAAGFDLGSLSNLGFGETTGAPTGSDVGFFRDNSGDLTGNVLTGKTLNLSVNGTDEFNFSSTGLAFNSNNITGLGTGLTGSGAVNIASGAGGALTINSDTTGNINIGDDSSNEIINIGTGSAAKTLLIGSLNTTSGVTIQSGTGNIKMQAGGASTTGNVQIGEGGGTGSSTPDLLLLDTKSSAGDPTAVKGAMYYNVSSGKFRCSENGTTFVDCIGAGGGGTPAGTDTQIQFNDGGVFGADADFAWDKTNNSLDLAGADTGVTLNGITNEPSAPAEGSLEFYAKSVAGRVMPKWIGPSGLDSLIQPMLAMNKIGYWNPPGNATTVPGVFGFTAPAASGVAISRTVASTNVFTRTRRLGYRVATAAANAIAGHRVAVNQYSVGNGSGLGGFFYVTRFGETDTITDGRMFVGISNSTAAPTSVEPSTLTNAIGVGCGTGNTNLYLYNGGSSAQTPIDLGVNFPCNTASTNDNLYELVLYSPTNVNNVINYRVTRLGTSYEASGTLTAATPGTQLPASTTLLSHRAWRAAAATAGSPNIDIASIYIETDY